MVSALLVHGLHYLSRKLLGHADRATRIDLDDRRSLPGWPVGLTLNGA